MAVVADEVEEAVLVEDGDVEVAGFGDDVEVLGEVLLGLGAFLDEEGVGFFVLGEVGDNGFGADDDEVGVDVDVGGDGAAPLGDQAFDGFGVLGGGDVVAVEVELAEDVEAVGGVGVVDEVADEVAFLDRGFIGGAGDDAAFGGVGVDADDFDFGFALDLGVGVFLIGAGGEGGDAGAAVVDGEG